MSDVATDLAVLKEVVKGHVELDAHRFSELMADVEDIKKGQRQLGETYTSGINRVHERIDAQSHDIASIKVSVEAAVGQTKAAITQGLNKQQIWIYSQAVVVLVFIISMLLQQFVLK